MAEWLRPPHTHMGQVCVKLGFARMACHSSVAAQDTPGSTETDQGLAPETPTEAGSALCAAVR